MLFIIIIDKVTFIIIVCSEHDERRDARWTIIIFVYIFFFLINPFPAYHHRSYRVSTMPNNQFMHPRNIYRKPPAFKELAVNYPEFNKYASVVSTPIKVFFKILLNNIILILCFFPCILCFLTIFVTTGFERQNCFRLQKSGRRQTVDHYTVEKRLRFRRGFASR